MVRETLANAAPLHGWELPEECVPLRRLLEARMGKAGKREYVGILRLLETFEMVHVHGAVRQALDLDIYPYLPRARVETTKPSSDLSLMSGTAA